MYALKLQGGTAGFNATQTSVVLEWDPIDIATIKMLVQEVMDGTMQNQKNLQAAKGQACAK